LLTSPSQLTARTFSVIRYVNLVFYLHINSFTNIWIMRMFPEEWDVIKPRGTLKKGTVSQNVG
jgi:hypothetical protein